MKPLFFLSLILPSCLFGAKIKASSLVNDIATALNEATQLQVRHLTRSSTTPFEEGTVQGFQVFPAGKYFFTAVKEGTDKPRYFIIQTEAKVGHLTPVDPGVTKVEGFVEEVTGDEAKAPSKRLTATQSTQLLKQLFSKWGAPKNMHANPDLQKGERPLFLNALAAVVANGDSTKLKKLTQ